MSFEVVVEGMDEFYSVAVETSDYGDHEEKLTKQVQVDLLAHCIFCLRKTVISGDSVEMCPKNGGHEMLQVVPRAPPPSPSSTFLNSFNRFWSDLQELNGNETRSTSRGDNDISSGVKFLDLPRMCEFCAKKMEAVHQLYMELHTALEVLGNIILESKARGKYSWREEQFEKTLRSSNLKRDVIDATKDLLEKLYVASSIPMNDPLSGLEDYDVSRTINNFKSPCQSAMSIEEPPETEFSMPRKKPGNPSDEFPHDTTSEFYGGEDSLIEHEEGHDDNQIGEDWVKSEPEDVLSDTNSTSEDKQQETSSRLMRSNSKQQTPPDCSSEKSNDKNNQPSNKKPRKRSKPPPRMSDRTIEENLSKWKEMEENQTFSKSIDPATKREIFKCEIDGCGVICKFWRYMVNHQVRNHKPKIERPAKKKVPRERIILQKCDQCGKQIPLAEIYEHMRGHVGEEYLVKCPNPQCKYVYSRVRSLSKHFRCNEKADRALRDCSKFVPSVTEYFESFKICQVCGHKATTLKALRGHLHRVHESSNQSNFPCPIKNCLRQFTFRQSVCCHLQEHEAITDEQSCCQCGSTFTFEKVEEHLKETHGAEEVLKCSHCPFLFSTREAMLDHLFEHSRQQLFSCDICGEHVRFTKYSILRQHYFSTHQIGTKYPCADCGHINWTQDQATAHVSEKHGAANVEDATKNIRCRANKSCDLCDATFSASAKLKDHKIQAHDAEPYKCQLCNATFTSCQAFYHHERAHGQLSVAEYRCDTEGCGRVFKNSGNLSKHISYAHQRRKHVCELCGKFYKCASGLALHKKSFHLGVRSFICDVCGESFFSGKTLRVHKLIHSEARPHVCTICGQRFRHKEVLKRHLEAHQTKGADFKPKGPMKHIRKRVERKKATDN